MFFTVFMQVLAEAHLSFLLEILAGLLTVPVMIGILVILFRIVVLVIVLPITIIRKVKKNLNKRWEATEEPSLSAAEEVPTHARKNRLNQRVPGVAGAGCDLFRDGSWRGSTVCFKPTCYDRQQLEDCSSFPLEADSLMRR